MNKQFHKIEPIISLSEFIERAMMIKLFTSSKGKCYEVKRIDKNYEMFFQRLDVKSNSNWSMNLKDVFQAYQELENFETVNFKPYVNRKHSPARGLLLHLGMLE